MLRFSVFLIGLLACQATGKVIDNNNLDNKAGANGCKIYLDSSSWPGEKHPMITDEAGEWVLPEGSWQDDTRVIVLEDGDLVNLACPGTAFDEFGGKYATAVCNDGSFDVDGEGSFSFSLLDCDKQPVDDTNDLGTKCGPGNQGELIQIGFDMEAEFEETILVCFDEANSRSFYSKHTLYKEILGRDTGNNRPSFDPAGYFDFDVNDAYSKNSQDAVITDLTGNPDYVGSGNYFMSRGHLSPNADFVYYAFMDSTFYFINVAPQWQVFNGGNWVRLEDEVREYVEDHQEDIVVYTGTSGVLQLKDKSGDYVDIYLKPGEQKLPAPRFYWKILVNEARKEGIAFVGVNNPYLEGSEIADSHICSIEIDNHPILNEINDINDVTKGIMYACQVGDLAEVFPEVPDLGQLGILS